MQSSFLRIACWNVWSGATAAAAHAGTSIDVAGGFCFWCAQNSDGKKCDFSTLINSNEVGIRTNEGKLVCDMCRKPKLDVNICITQRYFWRVVRTLSIAHSFIEALNKCANHKTVNYDSWVRWKCTQQLRMDLIMKRSKLFARSVFFLWNVINE